MNLADRIRVVGAKDEPVQKAKKRDKWTAQLFAGVLFLDKVLIFG